MPKKDRHSTLIQEGDQLLQAGDLKGAEQKYREALAKKPQSAEALYSIGAVYTHIGDFQTALEWAQRAVAEDPKFISAQALLGNVLLGLHRYEEALAALTLAAQDESNLLARAQMGLCEEALKQWEEAERHFRAVLENDPTYVTRFAPMAWYDHNPFFADVHHALARVLQRQGKVDEAKLHYHLTKRIDPTTQLDPMYLEIMNTMDLENHPAESWDFARPSTQAPIEEKIKYLAGLSDYDSFEEAVIFYKSNDFYSTIVDLIWGTQNIGEFHASALLRVIGDLLIGRGQRNLFVPLQSSAWKRLFELAKLVHTGELSEKESFRLAARLEFDWKTAHVLLDLVSRFIDLEPATGFPLASLVEQVLTQSPLQSDAGASALLVAEAYRRMQEPDKAAKFCRKALELYQRIQDIEGMLEALLKLGNIESNTGDFSAALSTIDQYIALAETHGKADFVIAGHYNRALTLLASGRAMESYQECLATDAMMQESDAGLSLRDSLVTLLIEAAKRASQPVPQKFSEELQQKTTLQNKSPTLLLSQVQDALEEGNIDESLSLIEQVRTKVIDKASRAALVGMLFELSVLLDEVGRLTEAMDLLREALWRSESIQDLVDTWPFLINLGILAARQSQDEEAATSFERALQEARRAHSIENERYTLELLAHLLIEVDPQRAVEYYGRFIELSEGPGEGLPAAWVDGMAALNAGRFRESIVALERLSEDKSPEAEHLLPLAFGNRGVAHVGLGEVSEAIRCWEKAADLWLKRGDERQAIEILGRVVQLLAQEGSDYSKVLTKMLECWEGIETSGSRRSSGVNLAQVALEVGELNAAERVLKEILLIAISDEWRDVSDELKIREALGRIYRETARYRESIEQYRAALGCALYLKDEPAEGKIRGRLGIAYRYLGDLDAAVQEYSQAIAIAERYKDTAAAALHRLNLATTLFLLGRIEEAQSLSLDALASFDAEGDRDKTSRVLILLLENVGLEGLPQELQKRVEIFLEEGLHSKDVLVRTRSQSEKAHQLARKGDFEGARIIMGEVITTLSEHGDRFNQTQALLERAAMSNPTQAAEDAIRARDLALSIHQVRVAAQCEEFLVNHAFTVNDLTRMNMWLNLLLFRWTQLRRRLKHDRDKIDFANKVSDSINKYVTYFLDLEQPTRAFELQEWGRTQVLTDLLADQAVTCKQANEPEVQSLLAQEADILDTMRNREVETPKVQPLVQSASEESEELERDLEAELSAAYDALERYDPLYVSQKRGIPVDMDRIRVLLSQFERPVIVITLDFVDNEVVAMTLRSDQAEPRVYYTGMSREQVEQMLQNFTHEMLVYEGESSNLWYGEAAPLLQTVAEEIAENDLVVLIPAGDLQLLPLHALQLSNGQMLIDRATVMYAPSLTVLERLQHSHVAPEDYLNNVLLTVGIAFPDEARAIALRFGGAGMCLSGNFLAKGKLRQQLSRYRMVHFACHGNFDSESYLDSGLILRATDTAPQADYLLRDEVLSLRDMMTWHLNSDLIVLSACETGRGIVAPSEFLGLSRGFLAAGTGAVIVTLWSIDDAATQAFMLTFYDNLQHQLTHNDKMDVAEALRQTQSRYAQETRLYNWAGFKLIGWPLVTWKGQEKND